MRNFEVIYNTATMNGVRYSFKARTLSEAKEKAPKLVFGEILKVIKVNDIGREIISGTTGQRVPVSADIEVKPLTISKMVDGKLFKNQPIVNGNGRLIMDDEWIYVQVSNYGSVSINVNRHHYCRKIYLQDTTIEESIGFKKMTPRLERFIKTVGNTIVFEREGKAYKIYLKKTNSGFDIDYVWPYWATCGTGGIMGSWDNVIKKYGSHPGWDYHYENGERGEHKLNVDLKKTFDFE